MTDRIASLEQRVQMQEDDIQLLKSALADVVRRLNITEEQQAVLNRKGPTKGGRLGQHGGSCRGVVGGDPRHGGCLALVDTDREANLRKNQTASALSKSSHEAGQEFSARCWRCGAQRCALVGGP